MKRAIRIASASLRATGPFSISLAGDGRRFGEQPGPAAGGLHEYISFIALVKRPHHHRVAAHGHGVAEALITRIRDEVSLADSVSAPPQPPGGFTNT